MKPEFIIPFIIGAVILVAVFTSFYFSKKAVVKRKLKKAIGKKISDFVSGDIAKVVGKQIEADKSRPRAEFTHMLNFSNVFCDKTDELVRKPKSAAVEFSDVVDIYSVVGDMSKVAQASSFS